MDPLDFFRFLKYKILFGLVFILYFLFFQFVARLLIADNVRFPHGVYFLISTSPPVSPQYMPFPLWGPFFSINTPVFSWAMTPLSLGISLLLSFLVAFNITLYVIYYNTMKIKASQKLLSSLGLIATSLSCSCELFTALIGSAAANLPFILSLTFMERLFEGLVVLAAGLLILSSYVLYSEIIGKNVVRGLGRGKWTYMIGISSIFASVIIPGTPAFSFIKVVLAMLAGSAFASIYGRKWKIGIFISISLVISIFSIFGYIYSIPEILIPLSFISGLVGFMGFSTLKGWSRLGILHITAWSLIMPGPISLLIGRPIPFFNFSSDQLIDLWITTWIVGTPLAWYAGVYYLQYLRNTMARSDVKIEFPKINSKDLGLQWISLGAIILAAQTLYFLTHIPYYVDYNGYDLNFLIVTTTASTLVMVIGSISLGYGISRLIKQVFDLPRPKHWLRWSSIFAVVFALLSGVIHLGVSGYPYPPILIGGFGIPMFEPSLTIYIPHIIGMFIYPLQLLQLISSSMIVGSIASYSFDLNAISRKGLISSVIGSVAVCPMCTISSFSTYSLGVVGAALAGTYFINFVNSLEGQLLLSFSSQIILLVLLIFTGRKTRVKLKPQKTLRISDTS
ncbi:hypothetical protein CM19_03825 [Candidatus Acidianus copahuensis]|uniref:Uncharacterized protein n=1 Tax=Candidatus Acidianus copahuensis TaxID=1160895 RepID=A0A031LSY4_9CREN|nr:hypothetical protein [Candidatus Acidianus copahuensis]EZQ10569.1 hypothetical protein CM19_03825 [Candidatus Acidianus copahuensis]